MKSSVQPILLDLNASTMNGLVILETNASPKRSIAMEKTIAKITVMKLDAVSRIEAHFSWNFMLQVIFNFQLLQSSWNPLLQEWKLMLVAILLSNVLPWVSQLLKSFGD